MTLPMMALANTAPLFDQGLILLVKDGGEGEHNEGRPTIETLQGADGSWLD